MKILITLELNLIGATLSNCRTLLLASTNSARKVASSLKKDVERGDFEEIMYLVFKAIERKAVLVLNKIKVQVLETEILNSNLN